MSRLAVLSPTEVQRAALASGEPFCAVGGLKALTMHPEHAAGFALRLRTIETRGWATRYRGRIAIHASVRDPDSAAARREPWSRAIMAAIPHGDPLVRGAVVATAQLVDCVPMVDGLANRDTPLGEMLDAHGGHFLMVGPRGIAEWHRRPGLDGPRSAIRRPHDDQLPYGDFQPGRWAWLLDDIQPTTERCPACWGRDADLRPDSGGRERLVVCQVCFGKAGCDPIPAKGRQGLWEWTP